MSNAILEAPVKDAKLKHAEVYCEYCKKPIIKKKTQSWPEYLARKYCDRECLARDQAKLQSENAKIKMLPDGTIMPIGKYLESRTDNGRLQADFYLGIMEKVREHEAVKDSAKLCMKCQNIYYGYYYKGLLITTDLASKAADWLTMNTFGRYGQRKAPDEKPKRTLEELRHRSKFLVKKIYPKNCDAILALMEAEGK